MWPPPAGLTTSPKSANYQPENCGVPPSRSGKARGRSAFWSRQLPVLSGGVIGDGIGSGPALGRVHDQYTRRTVMCHFVWDAAQYESAHAAHPPVADHDQVRGDGGSHLQQFLARVPTHAVRLRLYPGTISSGDRLVADDLALGMNSLVHFHDVNWWHRSLSPGRQT